MALITYLTRIQFDPGARRLVAEELRMLGVRAPMVVSDAGVVAAGIVAEVMRGAAADPVVFDATPENPTEEAVLAAVEVFRAGGCDGIVAIGGGSPLDLAKAVSLMATHPGDLADYAVILGGMPRITAAKPPVIAVPTTAGTGSEVGRAALITLADGRKLGFISPHMIPSVAICDPELTLGLPPRLTAATGMDAITHCVETFMSPRRNAPAEAIAIDGLRRGVGAIRTAVADGASLAARTEMMMAALEGGLTFQKGLGAVHALSHPLGGLKHLRLHHGTLNAVLLPHVLAFNAGSVEETRMAALAEAVGLPPGGDLAEAMAALAADLGLPATLSAMGVPRDCFAAVATQAVADHSSPTNPRPADAAQYEAMLESAYA